MAFQKAVRFEDITEPFEYVYPEIQEIGGVKYTHIHGGVDCEL